MKTLTLRNATGAAAAVALVLSLSACGGGDPGEKSGDDEALGPLDTFFEEVYGGGDEEQANAQMMEVEEIVASCMQEQGFEYTPVDYSAMGGGMNPTEELDVEWGTLEFAEQYGYGATTNPWGDGEEVPEETGEEWVDPNQDYVSAMSETEQTAYYEALYGKQTFDESDPEAEVEYNWETAGCQGLAQHEVYEAGTGMDSEEFTALQDEMSAMWEASAADSRLTELNSTWADCMADAGFTGMAAVGDGETSIYDEVNALWENAYTDAGENMTEDDYKAIEEGIQAQLAEITPREIDTAVADFTCREEIKYDEVQREVNFEYQEKFVEEHREELDAWMAAARDAKG